MRETIDRNNLDSIAPIVREYFAYRISRSYDVIYRIGVPKGWEYDGIVLWYLCFDKAVIGPPTHVEWILVDDLLDENLSMEGKLRKAHQGIVNPENYVEGYYSKVHNIEIDGKPVKIGRWKDD